MKSIFLVDDSPTILMSLKDILSKGGHAVDTAPSAEAAIDRLKSSPPLKLIITDYNMPGRNGVELIGEIRKMAPYRFVPILMLRTCSRSGRSRGSMISAR